MPSNRDNWLNHLNWQIDFYQRSFIRRRTDPEFPWTLLESRPLTPLQTVRSFARKTLNLLGWNPAYTKQWLNDYAEPLWETRALLHDELSKLLFDSTLVLRSTGHQKFYFPRIQFDDLVDTLSTTPFLNNDLPTDYLGLPLKQLNLRLNAPPSPSTLNIIAYDAFTSGLNSYRQYLIQRDGIDLSPAPGDTILDCGACIGDMSLIFAGLVGPRGQVHAFDPIPLHARYCHHQAALNPSLSHVLHINTLAVSDHTTTSASQSDASQISPGGLSIQDFSTTSLDDYTSAHLDRVDFIKMDIEGFEMDAIQGASNTIRTLKPRLAISAYHKPDDLWTIPLKLKSLNPTYTFYFGHHSPMQWESVLYAVQR